MMCESLIFHTPFVSAQADIIILLRPKIIIKNRWSIKSALENSTTINKTRATSTTGQTY